MTSEDNARRALRKSMELNGDEELTGREGDLSAIHPEVERRLHALAANLAENTFSTKANTDSIQRLEGSVGAIEKNTGDIVEFFNAGRGAFKFLGWLATVGKWIAYIAGAFTAILGAMHLWKTGVNPTDITPK